MGTALSIVGRQPELRAVDAFLDDWEAGFRTLVVSGEAGIGKTTVWREGRRRAEEDGLCVLWSRPSAAEAKLSLAGVADLLAPVGEEALAMLPLPQREALAVASLRAAPKADAAGWGTVAAGFLTVLRILAEQRPVVVAIDDVQWLDSPSRRVVEFAARRLERERVGLLLSARPGGLELGLGGAVAAERLGLMVLDSLSLAALGQIVATRLGRSLPRPVLVRVAQASGGNPFYALEIARLLIERGVAGLPGSALPVPDDLRKLTAARIRRLPASAREALELAAVLSAPDGEAVDLRDLAPAEEEGIVSVDVGGRIEFAHPLFASAVYGMATAARRRESHARAAQIVADPEERARHLALASRGPGQKLARQLDRAAIRAAGRGAPDAAADLAELAARRTPATDLPAQAERLLSAARWHFDAGDLARAEALASDTQADTWPAPIRAQALQLSAQLYGRRSNFTRARELAAAALPLAGDDVALRAGIELDLAYCSASSGDFPSAEPYARAAVDHAKAAGDRGLTGDALAVLTMVDFLCGRGLDEARLANAVGLEDPAHTRSFVMRPSYIRGLLLLWTGRLDAALDQLEALHAELVEGGHEGVVPLVFMYLVWGCMWRGELGRAGEFAAQARDAAGLLEDPTAEAIALAAGALVHAHDGQSDLARSEASEALTQFERLQWRSGVIWPLWALGLVELSEDNPAGVDALLGPLADQLSAMGAGDPVLGVFVPDEIEALVALGQLERAELLLEPFDGRARELDRSWAIAAAERCRGALAAARGELEAAAGCYERALEAHSRSEMPIERGRTLLLAGQARRRQKQRARARALLGEALERFEQAGALRWAARARAELDRVGGRAPSPDGLTATELRVAELAASGLSNREVAERAFVSIKTVEASLTRVYRKLGVRSRTGLAAALHAAGVEPVGP